MWPSRLLKRTTSVVVPCLIACYIIYNAYATRFHVGWLPKLLSGYSLFAVLICFTCKPEEQRPVLVFPSLFFVLTVFRLLDDMERLYFLAWGMLEGTHWAWRRGMNFYHTRCFYVPEEGEEDDRPSWEPWTDPDDEELAVNKLPEKQYDPNRRDLDAPGAHMARLSEMRYNRSSTRTSWNQETPREAHVRRIPPVVTRVARRQDPDEEFRGYLKERQDLEWSCTLTGEPLLRRRRHQVSTSRAPAAPTISTTQFSTTALPPLRARRTDPAPLRPVFTAPATPFEAITLHTVPPFSSAAPMMPRSVDVATPAQQPMSSVQAVTIIQAVPVETAEQKLVRVILACLSTLQQQIQHFWDQWPGGEGFSAALATVTNSLDEIHVECRRLFPTALDADQMGLVPLRDAVCILYGLIQPHGHMIQTHGAQNVMDLVTGLQTFCTYLGANIAPLDMTPSFDAQASAANIQAYAPQSTPGPSYTPTQPPPPAAQTTPAPKLQFDFMSGDAQSQLSFPSALPAAAGKSVPSSQRSKIDTQTWDLRGSVPLLQLRKEDLGLTEEQLRHETVDIAGIFTDAMDRLQPQKPDRAQLNEILGRLCRALHKATVILYLQLISEDKTTRTKQWPVFVSLLAALDQIYDGVSDFAGPEGPNGMKWAELEGNGFNRSFNFLYRALHNEDERLLKAIKAAYKDNRYNIFKGKVDALRKYFPAPRKAAPWPA